MCGMCGKCQTIIRTLMANQRRAGACWALRCTRVGCLPAAAGAVVHTSARPTDARAAAELASLYR